MAPLRSAERRTLPERLRRESQVLRLRARHLPMRVLPEGRAARARLSRLRDAHRGETCVILGNGPSIRGLDLASLDGAATFCLNRGYLLWEGSDRGPSFFVAVNDLVIDQFHGEIADLSCPLFVPWIYRDRFRGCPKRRLRRDSDRSPVHHRREAGRCPLRHRYGCRFPARVPHGVLNRDPARGRPPLPDHGSTPCSRPSAGRGSKPLSRRLLRRRDGVEPSGPSPVRAWLRHGPSCVRGRGSPGLQCDAGQRPRRVRAS